MTLAMTVVIDYYGKRRLRQTMRRTITKLFDSPDRQVYLVVDETAPAAPTGETPPALPTECRPTVRPARRDNVVAFPLKRSA